MSGAGRKTGYRKGVTDKYLNDLPLPNEEENEFIAQISGSRGSNVFEVLLPPPNESSLALLPTKFRKLIWVKVGTFVIVRGGDKSCEVVGGSLGAVNYMIEHILGDDQISHIQEEGLWPSSFPLNESNSSITALDGEQGEEENDDEMKSGDEMMNNGLVKIDLLSVAPPNNRRRNHLISTNQSTTTTSNQEDDDSDDSDDW